MAHRIVILGAGTGGSLVANRLHREYGDAAEIVVVDRDDDHIYQPGLLFVPFGLADPEAIVRSRARQLRAGIDFRIADVDRVDIERSAVRLGDGSDVPYDVLVIATGAELLPEETEGMTGPGWGDSVFTFYTRAGATGLRDALRRFRSGRLVVNFVDLPIKCPVAPLEFCFLADWYLHKQGIRDQVDLRFVTPLDAAFTKPAASAHLTGLLEGKGIAIETEFATGEIDGSGGRLVSWDEREVGFDLLVTVPPHGGAAFVGRLAGARGRPGVRTDGPRDAAGDRRGEHLRRSATRPTCPPRRPAPSRTSRARRSSPTCAGSSPASRSPQRSTATRTASSRRGSGRRS